MNACLETLQQSQLQPRIIEDDLAQVLQKEDLTDAEDEDVKFSVNNMLKAITASLLMEQVLAVQQLPESLLLLKELV